MPGGAFKDQIRLYSYHAGLPVGHIFIGKEFLAVDRSNCLTLRPHLETPTQEDMEHGDIAPLDAQGQPNPDGVINVGDALVILRKALGIVGF